MTYPSLSDYNMTGLDTIFFYMNDISGGLFIILLILSTFCVVTFSLYFTQKKLTGIGDFPASLAVGSFITTVFTIFLRLIPNLISDLVFGVTLVVCFLCILIFFFHKESEID